MTKLFPQPSSPARGVRKSTFSVLAKALDVPVMVAAEDEHKTIYKVLNGKNGENFVTLRTRLE